VSVHQWINGTDTPVRNLSAGDLATEADVAPGNGGICYGTKARPSDKPSCHNVSRALSIHKLLADTPDQTDPGKSLADTATFTEVPRPSDGSMSTLSPAKELAADTSGVFAGSLLPVVHTLNGPSSGPVEYVRPLTTDNNDVNANDIFSTGTADASLTIYVFTGQMLDVSLTADDDHVKSGQAVTFTGSATDSSGTVPADSLDYSWSFEDGSQPLTTTTNQVTHTFPTTGSATYFVQLTATGKTDGSGGVSESLPITVGKSPPSPPPTQSPTPGPVTTHTPTASPTPGPVTTSTPHPGPDSTPHPGKGKGTNPPKLPALGPGGLPGSLASRLNGLLTGQQPQLANPTQQLPIVSGQVIGGGQPLSLHQAADQASTLGSAPPDDATTRWSPGVVPIYVAVVLFLLGLGIGRERGWRRSGVDSRR
jgi:hypothetical protein